MLRTTVGQILVNESLPDDLRDYRRVLDKKGLKQLLRDVLARHPDDYKDIVHRLGLVGADAAFTSGFSVSLDDLKPSKAKQRIVAEVNQRVRAIANSNLPDEQKDDAISAYLVSRVDELRNETHAEGLAEGNNISRMVLSGSRGSPANVASLRGADLLVLDHKDRPVPIPITHSYAEGLTPAEYFANAYGTRKGVVGLKLGVSEAGFLNKQAVNATSRLLVTDEEPLEGTGYPVDTDDSDNEGAVLARDYGPWKSGTVLTPSIVRELRKKHDQILIHSPISSGGRGVPQKAAGFRERGGFSPVGDNIGIAASQSVGEVLSQSSLSAKHTSGVGGSRAATVSGFKAINQLIQVPKSFQNAATLSQLDGIVERIEDAPQGGRFVWVGSEQHYLPDSADVAVKLGQKVEAGDVLSTGIPNPAEIVKHKHIGEGRRYFANQLRKTLNENGISVHRRNLELISRGLINHVRVSELDGVEGALPDDIVSYDELATGYQPRFGNVTLAPYAARHKYLEKPVLHYSIGTRMTPSVIDTMKRHGVTQVIAHDDPPPFEPHMVRAMESTLHDPDFFRRLQGFYIGKGFLDAARRGGKSEIRGMNWGHALAQGKDFGRELATKGVY